MTRREKLKAMCAADPDDAFLAYGLAMEMIKDGDTPEGIDQLKRVIELHPDYQAAYFQLGQTLADQGNVDEARTWVERGIEAARRIGDAHAANEMEGFLLSL